ncbi:DUF4126 domain-containing protein [Pseudanabaena sp. FACHB-2040]|uniref:DUF4126 domain-containing protein n=1 Tax=Pseudanabaena sp. FACHB-2040 TaxID=2692859 RepID=UPI0016878D9B|nr:DUF4126 domain-containing protein [Pseudanabaena sp. FACHB-2040]MBD2258773.1 DUF4126 domain-containing protein [Pseudanabaena sp. FACHB-2040]
MDLLESIGIGLGLGAAAGFRIVAPFLVLSAVALFGHVPLADNLDWLGTYPAFIGLLVALAFEMLIYFIPWLDALAETVALPLATVAGTLLMALATNQLDPFAQWSLAIIAGGGTAATVRGLSGFTRLVSTATTGGLANFLIAIAEILGALLLSFLALALPLVVLVVVAVMLAIAIQFALKTYQNSRLRTPEDAA